MTVIFTLMQPDNKKAFTWLQPGKGKYQRKFCSTTDELKAGSS